MDYLKSLTAKQWVIIFCIIIFFVAGYLFFSRPDPVEERGVQLETLMRQGTAPVPVEETLNKTEVQTLLKQGVVPVSTTTGKTKELTKEQKDALLRLMSAPRSN